MPLVTLEQIFERKSGVISHSFAECVPQNGAGFGNFDSVIGSIVSKFEPVYDQIDLHLIDACFPENYGPHSKKILVTSNHIMPGVLEPQYFETMAPWFYAIYHGEPEIEDITPTRTMNCLIRRMDPIRQSWLYQLIRHGLLDQSYVSFTMDVSRHHVQREVDQSATAHDIFEQQFHQHCNTFALEHELIKNQVPYRSFDSSWSLDQVVLHSRFSLVLETYFLDPRMITVSEKTFRCLKLPRPWIVFSMKNTVQHLRDLGLDVLDDIVDHSYDTIDFEIDRQTKLLEIARDMAAWTWTSELLERCSRAAKHNRDLIAYWHQNYNHEIDAVIARAMEKSKAL